MPRPSIGTKPMTDAERQARCRAARAVATRLIRIRRPADHRSRARAGSTPSPRSLQVEYVAWLDTVHGRLISRNGNGMPRFEKVLDLLPRGCVFDGELVVLDNAGRPLFSELLFGRGRPTYVAFDLLMADGVDLRIWPLEQRKAKLARIGEGAKGWIALTTGVIGNGRALYRAVVDADLEGIVAKRLSDPYQPKLTRWHKIMNRSYSQHHGRAEWFLKQRERYGRRELQS